MPKYGFNKVAFRLLREGSSKGIVVPKNSGKKL